MSDPERAAVVSRWLELTRVVLPGMAAASGWPIRLDHCFMRVFLDHALQSRWDMVVGRPAIRHMPLDALRVAVAAAEAVVADPARLPALNDASLVWRHAQRRPVPRRTGAAGTRGGA